MTRLSFTQTTQNALRELDRLEGIRDNIAGLVAELEPNLNNSTSKTWYNIYCDRLNNNVLPAIREVRAYLISQEALVTKASN